MQFNFSEFKAHFYSRVEDFSVFDCEDFNLLKVVLDGLKVNYVEKGMDRAPIFKNSSYVNVLFFLKRLKYWPQTKLANEKLTNFHNNEIENCSYILIDEGRIATDNNGQKVSYYFNNIKKFLGAGNFVTICKSNNNNINADIFLKELLPLNNQPLTQKDKDFINSLKRSFNHIKSKIKFSDAELLNIKVAMNNFFIEYRLWCRILEAADFKYSLFTTHYHKEGILLALKRNGIIRCELQHGLIAKEDIFYVFPEKVRKVAAKALFPDKIFTYGSYWADVLKTGFEFKPEQIEILGLYQENNKNIDESDRAILDHFLGGNDFILVTTQTFLHDYFVEYVELLSADLSLRSCPVKIVIKNHPLEKAEYYLPLQRLENVKIFNVNTEYLLSECRWHVSCYSTTLYDAAKYGCQNFSLFIEPCKDYLQTFINEGISSLINKNQNPVFLNGEEIVTTKIDKKKLFEDFEINKYKLKELDTVLGMTDFKECSRCILSTKDDIHIYFNEEGLCNYCVRYDHLLNSLGNSKQKEEWLKKKVEQIKNSGKKKKYDCILGVSGGVDSSYVAYWAKQNDLRPLVVHFDNGWNSKQAIENIRNVCSKLNFDLQTSVVDWEEFREMQLAYLKAGVVDIEALTDHAVLATIHEMAIKYKVGYSITGFNIATEAIMPRDWTFHKNDWRNIKDIFSKFGNGGKIKTFPHRGFLKKLYQYWFFKLELIDVLNYLPYNSVEAKKTIIEKLSWHDYGGKHYESLFTKFYQAYILPTRFNIDKRKAHLSNLICSKHINRKEAYTELQKPLYGKDELNTERQYVLKKLKLTEEEFDLLMKLPPRSHNEFKTERFFWDKYFKLVKILKFSFK